MKYLNSIILCIAIATIGQCYAQQVSPKQTAYRLTQESYITPEMQWAALSLLDASSMTVNIKTGAVQGIQSIDFMLEIINKKLENPISFTNKEIIKNAAHAMLEATEIAIFVATIEAAYNNQIYIMYQEVDSQLSVLLNEQKNNIQAIISRINATVPYDQPTTTTGSYFSWFSTATPSNIHAHAAPLHFQHNADSITMPANLVQAIIKSNDYKQEPTAIEAANLLFKECFMAQQHHLKDRADKIKITLHSPVDARNYIFTHFPNFEHMCEIAKKIVPAHHKRTDLQAPVTPEQAAAHKLFLDIRQAIQTALYIANIKSSYNVGYILPASVTAYLNGVVSKLLEYDAELNKFCKEAQYGATQDDMYRDEQWAMITKLAAGTVAVTALSTGIFFFGVPAAIGSMITGSAGAAGTAVKGAAALTTAQRVWNAGKTVKNITDTVGTVGSTIATAGGAIAFGGNFLQYADKNGYMQLNELDPNARYVLDVAQKVATQAAVVGGAGMAVGGLGNSVANIGQSVDNVRDTINSVGKSKTITSGLYNIGKVAYDLKNIPASVISATQSSKSAIGAGTAALGVVNQIAGINNAEFPQNQPAPARTPQQIQGVSAPANSAPAQISTPAQAAPVQIPAPTNSTPVQIPAQTITTAYTKLITDGATTDGVHPLAKIATASQDLLQKGQTTPAVLVDVLQNVIQNTEKTATPEIAQGLNEIKQHVINLASGQQ